jgi:hypothetical protein
MKLCKEEIPRSYVMEDKGMAKGWQRDGSKQEKTNWVIN